MKPQKMKAYASFAEWKRDQSAGNQKLITALSGIVRKTAPEFTPTVKWGQGCWTLGDAPKVYIRAEPDHVQFGFFAGSRLTDPESVLVGSGKYVRHVKVFTTKGIPRKALVALLEQVIQGGFELRVVVRRSRASARDARHGLKPVPSWLQRSRKRSSR